jgi:UDP-N-acetylmuramate dehydrogenase
LLVKLFLNRVSTTAMGFKSLKQYNTFGIEAECEAILECYSADDIKKGIKQYGQNVNIIGGGSNILLTKSSYGPVMVNKIKGIRFVSEDEKECIFAIGGGEDWHNLVMWSVSHGLAGIETMALIPGTVGAAPIQNIGAYGTEQKDAFVSLTAINRYTLESKLFSKADCEFGYRSSIFKTSLKDQYIITEVTYKFLKVAASKAKYKDVEEFLTQKEITEPTVKDIANAVIHIRTMKLPDPSKIGNAGSFFKNPVITDLEFKKLSEQYEIPSYPAEPGFVKIPAAWLIDKSGFKGVREGETGTYKNQALVIVNHGNAKGEDILAFSKKIQKSVFENFKVVIEAEVNIW